MKRPSPPKRPKKADNIVYIRDHLPRSTLKHTPEHTPEERLSRAILEVLDTEILIHPEYRPDLVYLCVLIDLLCCMLQKGVTRKQIKDIFEKVLK